MLDALRRARHSILPAAVLRARVRSAVTGCPLPPGDDRSLFWREVADRRFLLKQFDDLGPIFRAADWGQTWTCIQGLARCRRFLRETRGRVVMETMDARPAFSAGLLRAMEGADHKACRLALAGALTEARPLADPAPAEAIILAAMDPLAREVPAPDVLARALSRLSTALLIRTFFGPDPGDPDFADMARGYDRLGPHGLVWRVQAAQVAAFRDLAARVAVQAAVPGGGVAQAAFRAGTLDAALLGNLVYMVEMARWDLAGLFLWALRNLADHPDLALPLAAERMDPAQAARPLATAFVRETLRLDQSERLVRRATEEFRFDGFLIPRNTRIRLCIWESHKDPAQFDDPFAFRIGRFTGALPDRDRYAAFGLDHHGCPLEALSLRACALLLGVVASWYRVDKLADGPAVRGPNVWKPAETLTLRFHPLRGTADRGA